MQELWKVLLEKLYIVSSLQNNIETIRLIYPDKVWSVSFTYNNLCIPKYFILHGFPFQNLVF